MPKPPSPPRADKAAGPPKAPPPPRTDKAAVKGPVGFLGTFAHRTRVHAGASVMFAAYVPLQLSVDIREATRLLIACNVGAWAFLILILHMAMDPRRDASVFSRPEDENQW